MVKEDKNKEHRRPKRVKFHCKTCKDGRATGVPLHFHAGSENKLQNRLRLAGAFWWGHFEQEFNRHFDKTPSYGRKPTFMGVKVIAVSPPFMAEGIKSLQPKIECYAISSDRHYLVTNITGKLKRFLEVTLENHKPVGFSLKVSDGSYYSEDKTMSYHRIEAIVNAAPSYHELAYMQAELE